MLLRNREKDACRGYARHVYIHEAIGDIGTQDIHERTARRMSVMDAAPVVRIDYAQIPAPADIRAMDKRNTDWMVTDLKRISRHLNILSAAFHRLTAPIT